MRRRSDAVVVGAASVSRSEGFDLLLLTQESLGPECSCTEPFSSSGGSGFRCCLGPEPEWILAGGGYTFHSFCWPSSSHAPGAPCIPPSLPRSHPSSLLYFRDPPVSPPPPPSCLGFGVPPIPMSPVQCGTAWVMQWALSLAWGRGDSTLAPASKCSRQPLVGKLSARICENGDPLAVPTWQGGSGGRGRAERCMGQLDKRCSGLPDPH